MLNPDPHPAQDISPTAALLDELALTGYRPIGDEQDPRPLPEADVCRQALADAFDAIGWMLNDTRLAEGTSDILWQFTNIWNDFLFGASFSDFDSQPMTVALNNLVQSSTGVKEYNVHFAGAIMAALPTLLVYIVAGRYFVRGLMAGSVKG